MTGIMGRAPGIHASIPPQEPGVVLQPATYLAMQRGIDQLARAIRPTLGPRPRLVALERPARASAPELLDNGAVIARRVIELADRDASMGVLFMRQMLWHLHEKVGDGTATAALLFQGIFNHGVQYIASGGNAARLREYLDRGLHLILDELRAMVVQVDGQEQAARIAETMCYDHDLAELLGEIMEMVSPYGPVDIRTGYGRNLKREYVDGSYWEAGLYSPDRFVDPQSQKAELSEPWILISNLVIEDPRQLLPVLEAAADGGAHSLVIIANQLSDAALGLLRAARQAAHPIRAIGVHTPEFSAERRAEVLPDMAVLLGGRPFIAEAGETLERITSRDFGRARRAWANRTHFGVIGGQGDPRIVRTHLAQLRAGFQSAETGEDREHRLRRIGKLSGGSATLWVGGPTPTEIEWRKGTAERVVRALRSAMLEGVVPGGGAALLACQPVLQRNLAQAENADERAAYHILSRSLEAPARIIAANGGYEPGAVLGQIRRASAGWAFDVVQNRVVDAAVAGLYDPASVVRDAVFSAVSSAALALTVDVLVHQRKIKLALEP